MQRSVSKRKSKLIRESILILAMTLSAMLLIRTFIIGVSSVNGTSMEGSVYSGDIVISLKKPMLELISMTNGGLFQSMVRNRIVIIDINGVSCIKRCVGLSGDTILIRGSELKQDTFIVGDRRVFVLGDNFRDSYDSRKAGEIDISRLNGIMLFRIPSGG